MTTLDPRVVKIIEDALVAVRFGRNALSDETHLAKEAAARLAALSQPQAGSPPLLRLREAEMTGPIYTASKTTHASKWRELRAAGLPINSTWIDEAGAGETNCFESLWSRCISEASKASAVLLYREPGEVMKGAFIEAGAALACGVPVHAVGCEEFSFVNHPLVTQYPNLTALLSALSAGRSILDGGRDGEKSIVDSAGNTGWIVP